MDISISLSCESSDFLVYMALDVISRIYGQETVINAYENVDPDEL